MNLDDMSFDDNLKAIADQFVEVDPQRFHGFAPGDRVQVVNPDDQFHGQFGKVVSSWDGCHPESCRHHCRLVRVDLGDDAKVWGFDHSFVVNDLTHVD